MEEINKPKTMPVRAIILVVVLILLVAGAVTTYFLINGTSSDDAVKNKTDNGTASVNNTIQTREAPSGMKLYTNSDYHFTVLYPETWPLLINTKNEKIDSTDVIRLSFNLYRPDIKMNEESLFVLFMKKDNPQQSASDYLSSHFNPPSKTSWREDNSGFAGGSKVLQLSGFDNPGEIGDLPYTGPFVETPDKQYVLFLAYPQEHEPYLTDVFGGTPYTMSDFLNSWRWY